MARVEATGDAPPTDRPAYDPGPGERVSGLPDLRRLRDRAIDGIDVHLGPLRRVPPSVWMPELQRALRPGGTAHVSVQNAHGRELRRLRRDASHYFDVAPTGPRSFFLTRRPTAAAVAHFEDLAGHYWAEIPSHIQAIFLERKIALLQEFIGSLHGRLGLDLGCGVGRFAAELRRRFGARIVGVDPSRAAVKEARAHDAEGIFASADALRLPFADATFDYAYTINVIHHLKRGEQARALDELRRVIKPGGRVVVHEMNTRNPLFSWYLRKVYPRVRPIDKGDEEFVRPDAWPLSSGWHVEATRYMSFLPDFLPKVLLGPARKVESFLEGGRAAPYSIHYAVAMRRT